MLAALWSMVWTGHLTVHLTALPMYHCLEISRGWIVDNFRLNIFYFKIIHILYPNYHPKIIGHNLKDK